MHLILEALNDSTTEKMDGCNFCRQTTDLKPISYILISNYKNLFATIPALQKHSKTERMRDCKCSFIIGKRPFIEWMASAGMAN